MLNELIYHFLQRIITARSYEWYYYLQLLAIFQSQPINSNDLQSYEMKAAY